MEQHSGYESGRESLYQSIDFNGHIPVRIGRIRGGRPDALGSDPGDILDHWHPEVEIVCTLHGNAVHYIDGRSYRAYPGAVFVVNSNSVHKILPDTETNGHFGADDIIAIVVHIDRAFLWSVLPEMENMRFLPEVSGDEESVGKLMVRMEKEFPEGYLPTHYNWFHLMSFTDELLYRLCSQRLVQKDVILPINKEKNMERLKGIMNWVEDHYSETFSQTDIARKFYFTPEYFSRFFHQNTGMTFTSYVAYVRCMRARNQLISTEKSVMNIALDCGFSDARGLINHFNRFYGLTPYRFRKEYRQAEHSSFLCKKV